MLRNKSTIWLLQNFSRPFVSTRKLGSQSLLSEGNSVMTTTNLRASLEENMKAMEPLEGSKVSIYHVPAKLRKVEPRAYDPHFISIGPYHRGLPSLQGSERLKLVSLNRVVGSGDDERSGGELEKLISAVQGIENEARECYSEDIKLSKDEFVKMMLLDGCFIIELFRDLNMNNFAFSSLLSKRWMLPVVRRDLITLENQLPMIVLKEVFNLTRRKTTPCHEPLLEELALRFFNPLMPRSPEILRQSIEGCYQNNFKHLLDLFHSSISPGKVKRCKEPHMYWSISQLKEAGIKVRVSGNSQPLDLRFERGVLRMPSLKIDDHTGSFFRNIVAYEQCHSSCKPDMTTYLFFLDKLINSADDVGLLHYEGVIQHSLGSNKQVAKLVNNLCLEVEHDGQGSYLCEVVESINSYSDRWWVKAKARLKHDYFSNLWVGISTIAGLLLLYLTLLQASCDAISAQEKHRKDKVGWWAALNMFLVDPFSGLKRIVGSASSSIAEDIVPKDPPPGGPQECI